MSSELATRWPITHCAFPLRVSSPSANLTPGGFTEAPDAGPTLSLGDIDIVLPTF